MKRSLWLLLTMLTLVACIRRTPTPTDSPVPTFEPNPTSFPTSTPTPPGTPVTRITIVPSATRLQPSATLQVESVEPTASPTSTPERPPTLTPSETPTPPVVDAGATATPQPSPTPTPSESPLPTPSPMESPLQAPQTGTPSLGTGEGESTTTPTSTPNSLSSEESWQFEKLFSHYDADFQEFYVAGEVVNASDSHQRLVTLIPVVLDENGAPVTSREDYIAPSGYDELRDRVSLAPDQRFSFAFQVLLPEDVSVEDNYEILIEAEPVEPAREDLDIVFDDFDQSDWPKLFIVEGKYENPSVDLDEFVAVLVTVYDDDERVIGVGLWYEDEDPGFLEPGEHEFQVETEMWEIVDSLGLELYSYKVQAFGY